MRQKSVHLMPPMSNFYARICVKATPSSNIFGLRGCRELLSELLLADKLMIRPEPITLSVSGKVLPKLC